MKIILNTHDGSTNFKDALTELFEGANTCSAAVSYLQISGWELFRKYTPSLDFNKMRLVCTDQLGITHPKAVRQVMEDGVQIRNYNGMVTYHPKVFLAQDAQGKPLRYLIGSANLSSAAFTNSVEVGFLGEDEVILHTLFMWFNELFRKQSIRFTPSLLSKMEKNWRIVAASRAKTRLRLRRALVASQGSQVQVDDLDTLEDVFATIQLPLGLLNMDYAANNIRNVSLVRKVLADWSVTRNSGKKRSELNLLGFANGKNLTPLGHLAAIAGSDEEVAYLWCKWLQETDNRQLERIHHKLPMAKRVFSQFWRLQPDVRGYFLINAKKPKPLDRRLLQTIEILCNANDIVQELSLEDMRTLAPLLDQSQQIPPHVRDAVVKYFANKGRRGWYFHDRKILPQAWQTAEVS